MESRKIKAYVLTSGGLDSTLAVKMLQEQGVEVTGVYVSTGFCINAHQKKTGRFEPEKADVFKVTEELGIDLEVIDISGEYIPIITNPKYGWGKNVNPCIDCRIHMLEKTRELIKRNGYDFIATGEVIGQRPMSQKRHTSRLIEEKSGLKGRLLRPLSAKLHPTTEAEKKGWVDRSLLGSISGRSRKEQMRLAARYGLKTVSTPAGGCCFLTDETYAVRFKNLLLDRKKLLRSDESQPIRMNTLMTLATGRHVKIRTGLHLIVGRNEAENKLLLHYAEDQIILEPEGDTPGPTALLEVIKNETGRSFDEEFRGIWNKGLEESLKGSSESTLDTCRSFLTKLNGHSKENISAEELLLATSLISHYIKHGKDYKIIIRNRDNSVSEALTKPAFPDAELLNRRLVMKANESHFISASSV